MMTYLTAFFEIFRFIKRWRERQQADLARQAAERAAERDHQLAMLETIFSKMLANSQVQAEAMVKLAEGQMEYAKVIQTWLEGFRINDPTPVAPIPTDPEPSNPVMDQLLELQQLGVIDEIDINSIPAELQQAYLLAKQEREELFEG